MILIIFIFICQEANASSGKVLIHSSYFHVHFLFFTFTPNLLTVLVVVGQPSLFTCWRAVACFLAGWSFSSIDVICTVFTFTFYFHLQDAACCRLTCWRAVACFLAEGPFPRSHRRPLPARKEDGGEGENPPRKKMDNKMLNQEYFQIFAFSLKSS